MHTFPSATFRQCLVFSKYFNFHYHIILHSVKYFFFHYKYIHTLLHNIYLHFSVLLQAFSNELRLNLNLYYLKHQIFTPINPYTVSLNSFHLSHSVCACLKHSVTSGTNSNSLKQYNYFAPTNVNCLAKFKRPLLSTVN